MTPVGLVRSSLLAWVLKGAGGCGSRKQAPIVSQARKNDVCQSSESYLLAVRYSRRAYGQPDSGRRWLFLEQERATFSARTEPR